MSYVISKRVVLFKVMASFKLILLLCSFVAASDLKLKKINSPPHCTHVTKDTDYLSKYKLTYPTVYIPPGQREAYQQMFCINPSAVNKAATTVCDWAAPPQVQFTLGDEYMHVVRQDPTGLYNGNVVITTYQLCSHNRINITEDDLLAPTVTKLDYY